MSDTDHDHEYPRDYTDRQLLESIWRKLDGLTMMVMAKNEDARDMALKLDRIDRWLHPALWSALDLRRSALVAILDGENIEPPDV